jgi:hypothetical protein
MQHTMTNHFLHLCVAGAALATWNSAQALDTLPGDALAPPVGTTLVGAYLIHNALSDLRVGGEVIDGPKAQATVAVLRVLRPMQIGAYQVNPQFALPVGRVSGQGTLAGAEQAQGVGDLSLLASVMLKQDQQTRTSIYLMPGVVLPTGAYDKNKLSIGENRSKVLVQLGGQTALSGRWTLDGYADATWFGKNNDFLGGERRQAPLYQLQSYLRYAVNPSSELSVGIRHYRGGENRVAGVHQNDALRRTSVLLGAASWIAPGTLLNVHVGTDTSVNAGFKASPVVELRLARVF